MNEIFNIGLLQNTLRTATPVILAGLGCLMTDHGGMMNIGLDGMMLISAFAAVVGSYFLGGWVGGLVLALAVGLLLGLFYGGFVIKFKSDEFIIGVALNLFAGGLTVFLLRSIFGVKGASPRVMGLPRIEIPWLADIPLLGPLLSGNTLLVYVSWVLVILCYIAIYKTPWGFWLRASGEHPPSLASAGIPPERLKYQACLLCGLFCGLAGAHLSLGYLTTFTENMTASRGFIAVACVIFGASSPPRVMLAALLFGFIDALGMRMQHLVSSNLTAMAPYLVTVLAMVLVVLRRNRRKTKQGAAAA